MVVNQQTGKDYAAHSICLDDSPHNSDGFVLHGWDGDQQVIDFISRRVMADWAEPGCYGKRKNLFREQYNALGKRNLAAIGQIVALKYRRGPAFNRQHPFVDILLSDIAESGEVLDVSELGAVNPRFPLSNGCNGTRYGASYLQMPIPETL
jgi:hypothetical protein